MDSSSSSPKKRKAEESLSRSPSPDAEASASTHSIKLDKRPKTSPEPEPVQVAEVGEVVPEPVDEMVPEVEEIVPELVPIRVSETSSEPKPESSSAPHENPRAGSPKSPHGIRKVKSRSSSRSGSSKHSGSGSQPAAPKKLGPKAEVSESVLDLIAPEVMESIRAGLTHPFYELARKFPMYPTFLEDYECLEKISEREGVTISRYKRCRVRGDYAVAKVYSDIDLERDAAGGGERLKRILTDLWISLYNDSASLIKCHGWGYRPEYNCLYIIMDPDEDLETRRRRFKGELEEGQVVQILLGIVLGLKDLHEVGFIHTDITNQNCFMVGDSRTRNRDFAAEFGTRWLGRFRTRWYERYRDAFHNYPDEERKDPAFMYPEVMTLVGGYDCCRYIGEDGRWDGTDRRSGRPQDKAFEEFPEYLAYLDGKEPAGRSFKSDVWSIGILAHELLTGQHPFFGWDCSEEPDEQAQLRNALQRIRTFALKCPAYEKLSDVAKGFIRRCISPENMRPTVDELLDTHFIYKHARPDLKSQIVHRNDPPL